jgi:hypothetical protein
MDCRGSMPVDGESQAAARQCATVSNEIGSELGQEQRPTRLMRLATSRKTLRPLKRRLGLLLRVIALIYGVKEQTAVIKDFHIIHGIKSLIDAYAGLVLSHSIEIDEAVAAGLGSISPDNWAVEISRTGRKQTGVPASTSRALTPCSTDR